ncbi:hypothetical protein P3W83_21865 [Cupriavidus basilensis]|nr:hypothetical protein [Cupriavidus basilensis]MDF3885080.1 hypothetical protein [Cupriavidus basilensis]
MTDPLCRALQRESFNTSPDCAQLSCEQCDPLTGKFPVSVEQLAQRQSGYLQQFGSLTCHCVAVVVSAVERGFGEKFTGACIMKNDLLAGATVSHQTNSPRLDEED